MYKYYFGKEEFEKYGEMIKDSLSGKYISKSISKAEFPGGFIYEANLLGIDEFDLLRALEGLCYNNMAYEANDSTYYVM